MAVRVEGLGQPTRALKQFHESPRLRAARASAAFFLKEKLVRRVRAQLPQRNDEQAVNAPAA